MGVQGLWQILEPTAQPVTLESLEGKRLAVDISLWLHQAAHGFSAHGSDSRSPHLVLLINRIAKLVFFKVRPVFVFDGEKIPIFKKHVLRDRQLRRYVDEITINKQQKRALKEAAETGRSLGPVQLGVEDDLFLLPDEPLKQASPKKPVTVEDDFLAGYHDLVSRDERIAFLADVKQKMKQKKLNDQDIPENPDDFANFQRQRVLQRVKVNSEIDALRKEKIHQSAKLEDKKLKTVVVDAHSRGHLLTHEKSEKNESDKTIEKPRIGNWNKFVEQVRQQYYKNEEEIDQEVRPIEESEKSPSDDDLEETMNIISSEKPSSSTVDREFLDAGLTKSTAIENFMEKLNKKKSNSPSTITLDSSDDSDMEVVPLDVVESESQEIPVDSKAEDKVIQIEDSDDDNELNFIKKDEDLIDSTKVDEKGIYSECQQLLTLLGLPYIVAPGEAEAQCAELERLGLVEGVVTDDSDIWLFGGLTKFDFIVLTMLAGGDYTRGLDNVGIVTALEMVAEFSGKGSNNEDDAFEILKSIRKWLDSDNVLELDVSNFDSSVYHKQQAFFIEFYSSWCGHCINYKPKWVEFATNLKDWNSVVQITVINCADEKNSPICREHEIDGFPTLKYFPSGSSSKADGQKFTGDRYDLDSMTLELVKLVHDDYMKNQPKSWPKMVPVESDITLDRIWAEADPMKSILAIVVDEEPFSTAFATMINYVKNPFVQVVSLKMDHPIAKEFGGVSVPTIHIFKKENQLSPDYSSHESVKFIEIQKKIDEYVNAVVDSGHQAPPPMAPMANEVKVSPEPNMEVPINWEQYKVQNLDIISAIRYMLYQEIPRKPIIKDENLSILKGWIHVLKKYIPGTAPIRRLFYRLDEWIQLQNSIVAENWIEKINNIQADLGNPLPLESKWMACKGSKSYLRGYTCGLWTTMHAVTVQAYLDEKDNPNFKPVTEVLEPLHQFIYKYLSCEICAKNFHKMAIETNSLSLVTRSEDVVLWLWRAHNSANKRLAKDASEDPLYPKRQFPPQELCHDCQLNGIYLEEKVLAFMTRYYTDIRTDGIVPEPGYKLTEFENGKIQKVANKHLNPKFNIHADKIDKLEEAEARMKNVDGSPKRTWRNIETQDYGSVTPTTDRSTFYFIWMIIIVLALILAYSKYKQNRSKFWKYYYSEYKLFPWSKDYSSNMKYVA